MKTRPAVLATALLAVGAPLLAACGSSGGNGSTAPSTHPIVLPTADCSAIAPLAQNAIAQLTPLATMPPAQAKPQLDNYINQLKQQEAKLTSPQSKADLDALVTALQNVETSGNSQAGATTVLPAISKIISDCGGIGN